MTIEMYTCAMCGGKGEAEYIHMITLETVIDKCPDCFGIGFTRVDEKSWQSKSLTQRILNN